VGTQSYGSVIRTDRQAAGSVFGGFFLVGVDRSLSIITNTKRRFIESRNGKPIARWGRKVGEIMEQLDYCYQKDPDMVSREIAGEVILVPIRRNVGDLESVYTLNETAALAWTLFDGSHTVNQIQDQIISEYEVDEDEAEQDLNELIQQLEEIGAIARV
jgi:hypothetical protein